MFRYRKVTPPTPLNINYNLFHTSPLIPVSIFIYVSSSKASAIMIIGIFAISAATEVTDVQLGNKRPPPHIFDNNINDDDSTGTYLRT